MTGALRYTGPGWYRIRWDDVGQPRGATLVVWIAPKYYPGYGEDWIAAWLTRGDRSAVMMEGRGFTFAKTIIERIETQVAA